MEKQVNALIEQRMNEMVDKRDKLVKDYKHVIQTVDGYFKDKHGRSLNVNECRNIAQCLDNAVMDMGARQRSRLMETTYSSNISFLGIQLPVIAALLPSLVLNEIAVVQALDRRVGSVFYLDVQYGQNKGSITSGSTMIGAKTGHATGTAARRYATTIVEGEDLGAAGSKPYSGNLSYVPVVAGTVVITDGVETFTDNGSNVLVTDASGGSNGTISYTDGAYSVTFKNNAAARPTAEYRYDYEKNTTKGVPEVNINITSESLTALDFPLRARYSMGAAFDVEKAHGLNLENELVKYLGGEVKFEVDHYGIDLMRQAAENTSLSAGNIGTWTGTPGAGEQWVLKKLELLDFIEKGNNAIIAKTLRGSASFIIAGNNVARVIRQLGDHFKPQGNLINQAPTGPYVLGNLDGRLVIHDPLFPVNEYVLGFKGDGFLHAGFVYAPYIPLFSTPTLLTSDLQAQKAFLTAAGFKVINNGMYCYGSVSGLL